MNKRKSTEELKEAAREKAKLRQLLGINLLPTKPIYYRLVDDTYRKHRDALKRDTFNTYLEGIHNFLVVLDKHVINANELYPLEHLFLPVAKELLLFYCSYSVDRVLSGEDSASSLEKRLSGISKLHTLNNLESPLRDPDVQIILRRIRRSKSSVVLGLKDSRNKAIRSLHNAGVTWNEMTTLQVETLGDMELDDATKEVVTAYLSLAGLITGPLFPSVSKQERLIRHTRKGETISHGLTAEALRKAARMREELN